MKRLALLLTFLVVLSGLGAASIPTTSPTSSLRTSQSLSLRFTSAPLLQEKNGDYRVTIAGAASQLSERNKPMLPLQIQTIQLPWGAQNIQVHCTIPETHTMILDRDIAPAQIYRRDQLPPAPMKDPIVYQSSDLYPQAWYSTRLGAGRNEQMRQVVFVTIACYPVRYAPAAHRLEYTSGFDLTITYDLGRTTPRPTGEPFDMVVIGPKKFERPLQLLIDHKNAVGVKTYFKGMEDILSQYNGTDPPEQVKYFIKEAYDTHNISYVLLVGGLKSYFDATDKDGRCYGSTAWWVPVRYVAIPEDDDEACLCDLYYGCLYNASGGFDSWDSNGDGVYAAWSAGVPNDQFDMNPEVFYGRLAVTTISELRNVVAKIIAYETSSPANQSWFKNVVGVGGKTVQNFSGKPDGEWLCDQAIENLSLVIPGLNPVRCYSTNRGTWNLTPTPLAIGKAIRSGASFVDMEGHGNPMTWNTIWFDGEYPDDWCGGTNVYLFWMFRNDNMLPMVIVGGCHNAMFNVTFMQSLRDRNGTQYFTYGIPTPWCFSWGLVRKAHGGAIGATGSTGYGLADADNPNSLSAELEGDFFRMIGRLNATTLGQAHSWAVETYLGENQIQLDDAFCITNWQFFGDPSLRIGGY